MPLLICKLNLGMRLQRVCIQNRKYSQKETLETYWMPFDMISDFIVQQDDITQIKMYGPKDYAMKIEKQTHEKELAKYSETKTNFTYN